MTQRAIPFDEVIRRFDLVRVPYNESGMSKYPSDLRYMNPNFSEYTPSSNTPSNLTEKVVYFYVNKQNVAEVVAEPAKVLPVAFRGDTDWRKQVVVCKLISDKQTLENITKSIHKGLFGK